MLRLSGMFAFAVAIVLFGLMPIAYAGPPDPTWGSWDDGDFGNVADYITGVSALSVQAVIAAASVRVSDDWVEPPQRISAPLQAAASPRAARQCRACQLIRD